MTTEFVLIRHGETEWNASGRLQGGSDVPLSDRGIAQANMVADELRNTSWDVIISSPLQRAFQTAAIIVKALGLDENVIVTNPEFRERSYGLAEGLTIAERDNRFPDGFWPESESNDELNTRVAAALYDLLETSGGKKILVIAHGGWIRAALRIASGFDPSVMSHQIPNTSRTNLCHDGENWLVGDIGQVSHLTKEEQ